jgi:hypothetical protein
VLKRVKEENQTLLRNLKKLLAKPNIETKMMLENPAYSKFLAKMKGRKKKLSMTATTGALDSQKLELEKKIKEEEGIIDNHFSGDLRNISRSIESMNEDNKNIFKMMTRSFQPPTWLKALMYAQQTSG